jgi:hypothetical protein
LKIYFNNHLVENLSILNIEFVNNGYVSISKNDFEEDLQIKFDKNSRIFQTLINNVYPGNLNPEFNILNENSVVIKPLLLNSGDRFTTSIVITEYKFINISARILGISKLMEIASTFTNYDTSFSGRFWGLISDYKKEIVEIAFLGIGGFSLALISGKLAFSALGVILIYILYFIIDKITAFSKSDR